MRIVLAVTLWKRPELTELVLDHYRRMRESSPSGVDLSLVAVGSEGRATREPSRRNEFAYLDIPNEPVGEKWNAAVRWARSVDPDGVILVNSDDLLSPNLIDAYAERLRDGFDFFGLRDSHIFELPTLQLGTWPGYEASYMKYRLGEPAGCARCFSRRLLETTGWRLWPARPRRNSSLDFWCTQFVKLFGFEPTAWTMKELGVRAVQIKTDVNITQLGRLPLTDLRTGSDAWPIVEGVSGSETASRLRALGESTERRAGEYRYEMADREPIHGIDEIEPATLREETRDGLSAMRASINEPPEAPAASIVINNHNYGEYLGDAIDSALAQSVPGVEVIVVDDGSTDDSPEIIDSYGHEIIAVHQGNRGQASAFNAGVSVSRGDLVCFLDADDLCLPDRVATLLNIRKKTAPDRPGMFHHRLEEFGASLAEPRIVPQQFIGIDLKPKAGEFVLISSPPLAHEYARRTAYLPFLGSPTSGVAIDRVLIDRLFPIPETHAVGADSVVLRGALLVADVIGSEAVLGRRRVHGASHSAEVQKHLIDGSFLRSMDKYLNDILRAEEKAPVISVFDSRGATRYFRHIRSATDLLRLAIRVPMRDPSRSSIIYALQGLRAAAAIACSRHPVTERSGATTIR